jgi:hypothetical protein
MRRCGDFYTRPPTGRMETRRRTRRSTPPRDRRDRAHLRSTERHGVLDMSDWRLPDRAGPRDSSPRCWTFAGLRSRWLPLAIPLDATFLTLRRPDWFGNSRRASARRLGSIQWRAPSSWLRVLPFSNRTRERPSGHARPALHQQTWGSGLCRAMRRYHLGRRRPISALPRS